MEEPGTDEVVIDERDDMADDVAEDVAVLPRERVLVQSGSDHVTSGASAFDCGRGPLRAGNVHWAIAPSHRACSSEDKAYASSSLPLPISNTRPCLTARGRMQVMVSAPFGDAPLLAAASLS